LSTHVSEQAFRAKFPDARPGRYKNLTLERIARYAAEHGVELDDHDHRFGPWRD